MKQCQNCGIARPTSSIGFYCPKCSTIISENYEKQKVENAKIRKIQHKKLIEAGYEPEAVEASFRNFYWHLIGSPVIILLTIPGIDSEKNWYWIIGIWEAIFLGITYLGKHNVFISNAQAKHSSGLKVGEVTSDKIIYYIFGTYCGFILLIHSKEVIPFLIRLFS